MKLKSEILTLITQFMKYTAVGGTAALVEWSSFFIFHYKIELHYLIAVLCSFILATAVNYLLSIQFVFTRGKHAPHKEAFLVYLVSGVGLALNMGLMWWFVGILSFNAMISKVTATGIVLIWNFTSRKVFIFRD